MTSAERAIDVLLIEDDPGDELITREAFEHNKIKNTFACWPFSITSQRGFTR